MNHLSNVPLSLFSSIMQKWLNSKLKSVALQMHQSYAGKQISKSMNLAPGCIEAWINHVNSLLLCEDQ